MPYQVINKSIEQLEVRARAAGAAVRVSHHRVKRVPVCVGEDDAVIGHACEGEYVGDGDGDEEHEPEDEIHADVCAGHHGAGPAEAHGDVGNVPEEGDAERDEHPPGERPGVAGGADGDDDAG